MKRRAGELQLATIVAEGIPECWSSGRERWCDLPRHLAAQSRQLQQSQLGRLSLSQKLWVVNGYKWLQMLMHGDLCVERRGP